MTSKTSFAFRPARKIPRRRGCRPGSGALACTEMKRWLLPLGILLAPACVPVEYDWVVVDARFRGLLVEVIEPGGYSSLLNVPPDRRRAFVLPLDTVEL